MRDGCIKTYGDTKYDVVFPPIQCGIMLCFDSLFVCDFLFVIQRLNRGKEIIGVQIAIRTHWTDARND